MRQVKLRKTDLAKDAIFILKKVGAVKNNRAYPNHVYMNTEDYKTLTNSVRALYVKEYPTLRENKIQTSVGMHMLNYGPNTSLGDAIKPGYILVDDVSIVDESSGT